MSDYPSMVHVQHIEFEGCDCVVMSPEEYGAALADIEAKDHEIDRLRAANARLQAWHDAVVEQPSFTNKYTYIRRPQPLAKE